MPSHRRSKAAVVITAIYVLLALVAGLLPFLAHEEESLAGIYLVMLALPWSILLGSIMDRLGIDAIVFNYVFLLVGVVINAVLLYLIVTAVSRLWSKPSVNRPD